MMTMSKEKKKRISKEVGSLLKKILFALLKGHKVCAVSALQRYLFLDKDAGKGETVTVSQYFKHYSNLVFFGVGG